jgi:hypothetical protein
MTYSLVSMPVLGFDLSRLRRGAEVAEVLLASLQLGRADLHEVASRHPGPAHRSRWTLVERTAAAEMSLAARLRSAGAPGAAAVPAQTGMLLAALERSPIGNLGSLVRLLRQEILDWTWTGDGVARVVDDQARAAGDVLAEAVAGAYASDILPPALVAQLRAPWAGLHRQVPEPDLGPHGASIRRVLRRITHQDPLERDRLRAAVEFAAAERGAWAAAVHDASWAVHLTGRVREAAAAQLLTVRAFAAGGLTTRDSAEGVWNAVSGLVQSLVAADLLGEAAAATLQGFWFVAFGENPAAS